MSSEKKNWKIKPKLEVFFLGNSKNLTKFGKNPKYIKKT
jgi:hypothetical protein